MLKSQASIDQFLFLRQMAIKKVFVNMQRSLLLLHHELICDEKDANEVETPYKIFGWSKEDFEARLKLNNMSWLDVFIMNLSKSCMEMRKLEIDIKELMEFTKLLYDNFEGHNTKIAEKLQSALTLLDLPENMKIQLNNNAKEEEELCVRLHAKVFTTKEQITISKQINALQHVLSDSIVSEPMETRYQIRYYNSLVDQFEDRNLVEQNKIQKEIERYTELMRIEEYCSQCTVNALYAETNKYRTRLDELNAQYSKEYEAMNNKIAYKRVNFEKMRVQRIYLEEEIFRFKEEIANVQRQMELQTMKRVYRKDEQKNTKSPLALEKKRKK